MERNDTNVPIMVVSHKQQLLASLLMFLILTFRLLMMHVLSSQTQYEVISRLCSQEPLSVQYLFANNLLVTWNKGLMGRTRLLLTSGNFFF